MLFTAFFTPYWLKTIQRMFVLCSKTNIIYTFCLCVLMKWIPNSPSKLAATDQLLPALMGHSQTVQPWCLALASVASSVYTSWASLFTYPFLFSFIFPLASELYIKASGSNWFTIRRLLVVSCFHISFVYETNQISYSTLHQTVYACLITVAI